MAATIALDKTMASEKMRRTRKTHSKVKTGCLTCKIRRKKCDETKPNCLRCTSTGRKCDGYAQVVAPLNSDNRSPLPSAISPNGFEEGTHPSKRIKVGLWDVGKQALIPRGLSRTLLSSDVDVQCFDYFRFMTGPQLGSYFDSSVWKHFAPKAAFLHPAVLKAAAAVGAVHRRHTLGLSREAFEYCVVADRLQKEAWKTLRESEASLSDTSHDNEIRMVFYLLLSIFETFQGNYGEAANNMYDGLSSYWCRPVKVLHSQSRYRPTEIQPMLFYRLFTKLRTRAVSLFGRPPRILTCHSVDPLPKVPSILSSLHEALDLLFTQVEHVTNAPARLWLTEKEKTEAQAMHTLWLREWDVAHAETIQIMPERTKEQRTQGRLLKLVRSAINLLLYITFFITSDEYHEVPNSESHPKDSYRYSNIIDTTDRLSVLPTPPPTVSSPARSEHSIYTDAHDGAVEKTCLDLVSNMLHSQATFSDASEKSMDIGELTTNLTRISFLTDSMMEDDTTYSYEGAHDFSFDTGTASPRKSIPGARCCPNQGRHAVEGPVQNTSCKTRHLIQSLLSDEHKEQLWSTPGLYHIAEAISAIEEHAVDDVLVNAKILSAADDVRWVDVTCFVEDRRLLLKYCKNDPLDWLTDEEETAAGPLASQGLIWTQEWISF